MIADPRGRGNVRCNGTTVAGLIPQTPVVRRVLPQFAHKARAINVESGYGCRGALDGAALPGLYPDAEMERE